MHFGFKLQLFPVAQHPSRQGKELVEPLLSPLPLRARTCESQAEEGEPDPLRQHMLLP